MILKEFFTENNNIALGFSGGVDSSYLLYAALKSGAKVRAYYVKTAFQPEFEFRDAKRLAAELGADLKIIEINVLDVKEVCENPSNRCYFCKTAIFSQIKKAAMDDGFKLLIDGTNASDDADDRPGIKALNELSVRSPLRECGLTKTEIRRLSKDAGLFTWDKPSYACLATRVPTGTVITAEALKKVEAAEDILFSMGYTDFRVRILENNARLQIKGNQFLKAIEEKDLLIQKLAPFFSGILLDLNER